MFPQEEKKLRHMAHLTIYPWRLWESILPFFRREKRFEKRLNLAKNTQMDLEPLIKEAEVMRSPRWHAWHAQLLILCYLRSKNERELLQTAAKQAALAAERRPSYPVQMMQGILLGIIGDESRSKKILTALNQSAEAQKVAEAKNTLQKGVHFMERESWLKARRQLKKGAKNLAHEPYTHQLLKICRLFDKIDEVHNLCNRSSIVTIGRARVRYYEYAGNLMHELASILTETDILQFFDPKVPVRLKALLGRIATKMAENVAKEAANFQPGGDYHKRLQTVLADMKALLERLRH